MSPNIVLPLFDCVDERRIFALVRPPESPNLMDAAAGRD